MMKSLLPWATTFILSNLWTQCLADNTGSKQDRLKSCLQSKGVEAVAQGSEKFSSAISSWNLRLKFNPVMVVVPKSTDQISAAVACGESSEVRVTAKSGGHSFGSYGLGGEDGHLLIDLAGMNQVKLDNGSHVAKVQPGARLGHVATELFNQGRRAFAHGACPGVGVAGHVLHGGYGYFSQTHGLALDWLTGATVVLGNGSVVHCSKDENKDLFWALRGAGSSFGIVSELEFNTFEAPSQFFPFKIQLQWNETKATREFQVLQNFIKSSPKELNMELYMETTFQSIDGAYFGDEKTLRSVIKPLLDGLEGASFNTSSMSWMDALSYFANGEELISPSPYKENVTAYASSLMTPALSEQQVKSLMSTLFGNINDPNARHSWSALFQLYGGNNSAVAAVKSSDTSFPHRDKLLLYQFFDLANETTYSQQGFGMMKGFRESVTNSMKDTEWGMYANYLDTEQNGETAQKLYWGGNLQRLQGIKKQLDPKNVFWNPQGIQA
ncbi:hypothetical protein QQS21_009496 [Conoideocrella luteorostrata]|uniref:FAD-binding PCMH-type domain-containing protein n=1 Tax=Conoideocrella luteorostrata TaxID=1105319 RepID=A0AAJ0CJH2_9HYPO|nr:hypothetical protein QQS21_009496 [Conoideocrella luteorostrata]